MKLGRIGAYAGRPFSPPGDGHGGHGRWMCSATRRLHGLSAGRRSVSGGGHRPCRLRHRRTLRPAEARRGLCAAAESGARFGSKPASKSGLCGCACRGCAGPRPRLHDGACPRGCDGATASSAGRGADGCATNGRRACAGSECEAGACCFGGPCGGSGRRPCASAGNGGCACADSTCCARAGTGRKAGARCFDSANTGTNTTRSRGRAGGASRLRAGRRAARLHTRFRRPASGRRVRSGRTDQRLFGRRCRLYRCAAHRPGAGPGRNHRRTRLPASPPSCATASSASRMWRSRSWCTGPSSSSER